MQGFTPAEEAIRHAGVETANLLIGLVDLEVFYRTHPGAPVPQTPVLSIRIPDCAKSREQKITAVEAVAEALGVHAVWENGTCYARRQFGPLLLECHYCPAQLIERPAAACPAEVPAAAAA